MRGAVWFSAESSARWQDGEFSWPSQDRRLGWPWQSRPALASSLRWLFNEGTSVDTETWSAAAVQAKVCNASEPLAVPTEGVGWWQHTTPTAEVDNRSLILFDRGTLLRDGRRV